MHPQSQRTVAVWVSATSLPTPETALVQIDRYRQFNTRGVLGQT